MILHQQTPSQSSQGESTEQTKAKCPWGFGELILPLQRRAPSKQRGFFGGMGGLLGHKRRGRVVFLLLLLRGLSSRRESRLVWAGPIRSGGSLPASSGFPALSSPPTLWYLLSSERERERKELFIFDATEATFFGRAARSRGAGVELQRGQVVGMARAGCSWWVLPPGWPWFSECWRGKAVFMELGPSWESVLLFRALEGSAEPAGTRCPRPCWPLCFLQ